MGREGGEAALGSAYVHRYTFTHSENAGENKNFLGLLDGQGGGGEGGKRKGGEKKYFSIVTT